MTPDELSDRLMEHAVRVCRVTDNLGNSRLGRHAASQLVRCGTSPGPNYEEGCAAESRDDFIHKLRISLKELRECRYWLRLIVRAEILPDQKLGPLIQETTELCSILGASLATADANRRASTQPRKTSDS